MNSKNTGSTSIKQMIKEAKLPERSVSICLDQGLQAEYEGLERELAALLKLPDESSLGDNPRVEKAEEMAALEDRMRSRSVDFVFRALPRRKFTALLKAHPPREDDLFDKNQGYNTDTFYEDLIRRCSVSPELDADDWTNLIGRDADPDDPEDEEVDGVLSSAQYDMISNTAWMVNRRDVDIPFSPAASRLLRTSSPE